MGLKECFKTINNREIIAYDLSEQDLQDLQQALNVETPFGTINSKIETPIKTSDSSVSPLDLTDKLIEYSKYNDERIEKYIERAFIAEQKQKLIETSEINKDAEINRLNALVKQLQSELEIRNKKWWRIGK